METASDTRRNTGGIGRGHRRRLRRGNPSRQGGIGRALDKLPQAGRSNDMGTTRTVRDAAPLTADIRLRETPTDAALTALRTALVFGNVAEERRHA